MSSTVSNELYRVLSTTSPATGDPSLLKCLTSIPVFIRAPPDQATNQQWADLGCLLDAFVQDLSLDRELREMLQFLIARLRIYRIGAIDRRKPKVRFPAASPEWVDTYEMLIAILNGVRASERKADDGLEPERKYITSLLAIIICFLPDWNDPLLRGSSTSPSQNSGVPRTDGS